VVAHERPKKGPMSNEQKLILSKGVEHHRYGVKRTERELMVMRENHPKRKIEPAVKFSGGAEKLYINI
jgi:hypothetical protein